MKEENKKIVVKCPLSGISCDECKWRIEHDRYSEEEDCYLFTLIHSIGELNNVMSDLCDVLIKGVSTAIKRFKELNETIIDLKEALIERSESY